MERPWEDIAFGGMMPEFLEETKKKFFENMYRDRDSEKPKGLERYYTIAQNNGDDWKEH